MIQGSFIWQCPDNANHTKASDVDERGACQECGKEKHLVLRKRVKDPHTPEPWRVGLGNRVEAAQRIIADMTYRPEFDVENDPLERPNPPSGGDDAERIVACVNMLAGIPKAKLHEALERYPNNLSMRLNYLMTWRLGQI